MQDTPKYFIFLFMQNDKNNEKIRIETSQTEIRKNSIR